MKRSLLLLAFLASLTVQGQDKSPVRRLLIGFNFSPDYAFRSLKNNDGSSSSGIVIRSRNDIEVAKFGYTTGLNLCFHLTQHFGIETGVQFSNKGYKTKKQDLFYFPPNPNLPQKVQMIYAYQYLGIPLKAKFSFGKEKVRFLTGIGFITNFLLTVKQTTNYEYANGRAEKNSQSSKSDFTTIDLSPMISAGVDYKLNNKIHLLAEPVFRYGVIKTKDTPVTENLWSAGLNIGFYYLLK